MKEKRFYLIYKITNNLNQKFYIGKHETDNLDDDYFGSGKHLKNAQNKYGIENFTKTILFYCANREEMNLLEHCVVTPEFCQREDTYNINEGGDGGFFYINQLGISGKPTSKFAKQIGLKGGLSLKNKLKSSNFANAFSKAVSNGIKQHWKEFGHNWLGKHHSEESKKKIGLANSKRQSGSGNSMYGKMWICNDLTKESKPILKTDPIPNGWRKGRIYKKQL